MTFELAAHWHYATGFAGYGPDGADGYSYGADAIEAANGLSQDLRNHLSDAAYESAEGFAARGDYESAWKSHKLSEALDVMGRNLDASNRASAPLYADNPKALAQSMAQLLREAHLTDLDINGHVRLYVWQCCDAECEHVPSESESA